MTDREQLRAALVDRAMKAWLPDAWGDICKDKPSVAARLRKDMGDVIDALGVVEMAEALDAAAGQKIGWTHMVRVAVRKVRAAAEERADAR